MGEEIRQTRPLPAKLKTLRHNLSDWSTEQSMRRCNSEEFDQPSCPSFVRHRYTNYERLLKELPNVTGKTEGEVMDAYFERDRLHRELRDAAEAVAIELLTAAYGESWQ